MNRSIRLAFLAIFSALYVSSAFGSGYVNPDYSGKRYRSVLVSVPVADLEFRERLEKAVAKQLRGHTHLAVFSPAKQYSEKEIKKELERLGIDAVVVVNPGDVEDQSSLSGAIAQTHQLGYTNMTTVTPVGMKKKAISATVMLFDSKTGEKAWVGSAKASGKGLHAKEGKVISRLAEEIADQLEDSKLLAR